MLIAALDKIENIRDNRRRAKIELIKGLAEFHDLPKNEQLAVRKNFMRLLPPMPAFSPTIHRAVKEGRPLDKPLRSDNEIALRAFQKFQAGKLPAEKLLNTPAIQNLLLTTLDPGGNNLSDPVKSFLQDTFAPAEGAEQLGIVPFAEFVGEFVGFKGLGKGTVKAIEAYEAGLGGMLKKRKKLLSDKSKKNLQDVGAAMDESLKITVPTALVTSKAAKLFLNTQKGRKAFNRLVDAVPKKWRGVLPSVATDFLANAGPEIAESGIFELTKKLNDRKHSASELTLSVIQEMIIESFRVALLESAQKR